MTVAVAAVQAEPDIAARKNDLYADAVVRHGATPVVLDATASPPERAAAFAAMDGLLLSGGADLDPILYGQPIAGSVGIEPDRDALEAEAWSAAIARSVPILGLCRGLQAINVFSGGSLLQHVDGHVGAAWGHGPAATHPLRVEPRIEARAFEQPAHPVRRLRRTGCGVLDSIGVLGEARVVVDHRRVGSGHDGELALFPMP